MDESKKQMTKNSIIFRSFTCAIFQVMEENCGCMIA